MWGPVLANPPALSPVRWNWLQIGAFNTSHIVSINWDHPKYGWKQDKCQPPHQTNACNSGMRRHALWNRRQKSEQKTLAIQCRNSTKSTTLQCHKNSFQTSNLMTYQQIELGIAMLIHAILSVLKRASWMVSEHSPPGAQERSGTSSMLGSYQLRRQNRSWWMNMYPSTICWAMGPDIKTLQYMIWNCSCDKKPGPMLRFMIQI